MEELSASNKDHFTLAVATISVMIFAISWRRWKSSSSSGAPSLPPGPRSLPIVGYLPFLRRDLHKQFRNMAHIYGPIFKFHLGSKLHVVINTPDLVKAVVREQDDIFSNRNPSIAALAISYGGRNVVFSDNNSDWRNLRKIFAHEVLSNKNLEACRFFRRDEVRKTIKNIYSKIGTTIDISEIAFSTEANVLTSMVWENTSDPNAKGRQFGAELKRISSNIVELLGQPNLSDIFPSVAWLDLQGILRKMKRQDCIVGGYTIPKGCTVLLNVWSIHRDHRYWDNPLIFNPERFLTNKYDFKGGNLNLICYDKDG
ncbi:ferruginol synthase 1 [Lactuca sativa]|uniref:Cytochrome P450 n=1 Tax=Lactuca sativa TaxID=4236 RepID=A0A9R1V966_LACSA|nr:ferruginol synthase 1 [Lactuca sativa]KAJ0201703.1 hypothetical protein LSAT_V11C600318190 [Lactuca sativa]